jgi:hypothetical protein
MRLDLTFCKYCGCVYSTDVLRPIKENDKGTYTTYTYFCKLCTKEWSDFE